VIIEDDNDENDDTANDESFMNLTFTRYLNEDIIIQLKGSSNSGGEFIDGDVVSYSVGEYILINDISTGALPINSEVSFGMTGNKQQYVSNSDYLRPSGTWIVRGCAWYVYPFGYTSTRMTIAQRVS
jgi:hypothetical protein